jgi:hypothetical protein
MNEYCGAFDLDVRLDQWWRLGTARPPEPEMNKSKVFDIDRGRPVMRRLSEAMGMGRVQIPWGI